MGWLKIKLIAKKTWIWAKRFWWIIILVLGLTIGVLVWLLTRNGAYVANLLDLIETKRDAHDQEMETLAHIHNTEIEEKNARLEEHLKRRREIEEKYKERGETLNKEKEAELKRIVNESYNDPEKLAKELAEAFGIKNG
jgi:predicted Holliday junction resolvase-like endonuclease|tara:strand:- start:42 stop:458 length:417 start_codon:yes stop_codon:yes gene_type:complete